MGRIFQRKGAYYSELMSEGLIQTQIYMEHVNITARFNEKIIEPSIPQFCKQVVSHKNTIVNLHKREMYFQLLRFSKARKKVKLIVV